MGPEQKVVLAVWAGLSGLLVGSFLNVCIFRLPRDCMSVVRPRSRCPKCRTFIAWYDNFPVFSWLALGGKCRHCRSPIPLRYPLIELLTGALFAWAAYSQIYLEAGDPWRRTVMFVLQAYLGSALIVSTFIDLDLQILPDEITLSGVVLGILAGAAFPFIYPSLPAAELFEWAPEAVRSNARGLMMALVGAILGGGVIYTIGVMGKLIFRKEAMGFGDVKYMAFLGAFLGPTAVAMALLVGVFAGALFGIFKFIFVRRMGYVPFGPFLSVGAAVMIFAPGPVHAGLRWYLEWIRGPGLH